MSNMMEYKGYLGSVTYSDQDATFFGKVEFIRSLVSFEGSDVESLKRGFQEAVDDYLTLCQGENIQPDKPFKGSFNVRTGSDLHRKAVLAAKQSGVNLNTFVTQALEHYIGQVNA